MWAGSPPFDSSFDEIVEVILRLSERVSMPKGQRNGGNVHGISDFRIT